MSTNLESVQSTFSVLLVTGLLAHFFLYVTDWSRGQLILAVPSPFRDVQIPSDRPASRNIQHSESLLNLGVHFNSYSDVFEDIASLPVMQTHNSDVHSDEEHII